MADLLQCPFCGGEGRASVATVNGFMFDEELYYIKCIKCNISTTNYMSAEEAVKSWNKRSR